MYEVVATVSTEQILARSLAHSINTHLLECGGDIDLGKNGKYEIRSPNFPEEYPSNSNCSWVVTVPKGNQIAFHFDQFEIDIVHFLRFYNKLEDFRLQETNGIHFVDH